MNKPLVYRTQLGWTMTCPQHALTIYCSSWDEAMDHAVGHYAATHYNPLRYIFPWLVEGVS